MVAIDYAHAAAAIIRDAGGRIVGRTKLQKIGFFLEAAGLGGGFPFQYKHYGPYSEQLAFGSQHAAALRLISENETPSGWGALTRFLFQTYRRILSSIPPVRVSRRNSRVLMPSSLSLRRRRCSSGRTASPIRGARLTGVNQRKLRVGDLSVRSSSISASVKYRHRSRSPPCNFYRG
jgi:hypothetical protein